MTSLRYVCPIKTKGNDRVYCNTDCMWFDGDQDDPKCVVESVAMILQKIYEAIGSI